ncbi:mucin-16-like isoform X5 [Bos javanicus]|uniref:mucin-16-like isoform X5 n=1 Tax=Bos javanicus TaxID=9906 RepID=UPI002AA7961D|nr:mucin-16-like isoform X5 [Bos javanicus]
MGRKDPGRHRRGHLVALTVSLFLTCWPGPTASTTSTQSLTRPGSSTHITPENSRPTGTTDSTSISKTSTLTSGEQRSPENINLSGVSEVTITSPSTIFVPENTINHSTVAENETKGTLSASISPPETSATEKRHSWGTSSNTSDLSTVDSQQERSTQVSPSHTAGELRSPDTTADGYSPSTTAPGSSAISRTLDSSTSSEEMWAGTGTSEPSSELQSTSGTETSPTEETVTTDTDPIHTSLTTWVVSVSTEPSTSFPETASPGETSSDTPTLEATAGPTAEEITPSTEITWTGDSDTGISQDTAPLPTGATAPSETAIGLTSAFGSAPVSMLTAVTMLDPGSSAPGGTTPTSSKTSSKMPGKPDSKEATSQVLTLSNAEHHFSSPDTSPPGDLMSPTSVPLLLSASITDPTGSRSSPSSDHMGTSSKDTETPGSTGRTEPNPAFLLSRTSSHTETSAERVRGTTFPLDHPSPSGEGTAKTVLIPSTSPDATDSPPITTASTLVSEVSTGLATLGITQVPGVKTTSPSTTSVSEVTSTHPSMTEQHTREPLTAPVAPSVTSAPGRENNSATTSAPSPGFSSADGRGTSSIQVSKSHPGWELRTPHTTSERHSPSTTAPESSDISRTLDSSTPGEASWTNAGTSEPSTEPQSTWGTETSSGEETLTSETGHINTSSTSFTETASPGETSSDTPTLEAATRQTTEEFVSPTEISQTGDSDTRTSQDMTYPTTRDTTSSETITHLTPAISSAPVSMATAVITVAPGSSAPAGTTPTSSKISSTIPEVLSTGNPGSGEPSSWGLTPSTSRHHFFSPETGPAGDIMKSTSPPLLMSTSIPGGTASGLGTSSDLTFTSSVHTETSETTAKTELNSASPLSSTLSNAETSTERVRGSVATTTMDLKEPGGTTQPMGSSTSLETISLRPNESVATITREPSQGEHGGASRPTSNPASLMTTISVGMSTRSPEMATALKIISSQEPSISPETRYTLENSQKTSTAALPMVSTVEPGTLQSMATGSGRISLLHSPSGFMTAAKSPARGTTTEWVSGSPSEDWTNTHLGTPEGTKKSPGTVSSIPLGSAPKVTTGTSPQSSPTQIPRTTGMRSEQTAGRDLTLGGSPGTTDMLPKTSIEPTILATLTSESQAMTSLTNASEGKTTSSPSVTFPSMASKMLAAITSVVTSDVASDLGQLSQTSSPAAVSTTDVTTALTPSITTMETNSVLTTKPKPKESVGTMDSTLATETSTSALEHPLMWPSTASPASTFGPWTIPNMTSSLEATSSPTAISAMGKTSSLASSTESGSEATLHDLVTVIRTSLIIPSSYASAEKTEASTSVRTSSPLDETASVPFSTSVVERMSTSFADILSTSWTPSRRQMEAMHVSMASMDHPDTKISPKVLPSTPLPDSLSTRDWVTRSSVSSAITTTSAHQGVTTPSKLPLENMISTTTSQPETSTGDITSRIILATIVSSPKVTLLRRPDLASKEAEKSSTQLSTTAAADPGHLSIPEGNNTFSPVPATSVLTSDLGKTTEVLGTSLEPVTSTLESVNNISQEIQTSSEATSDTETTHSSRITAVTDTGITSSANTEPPKATSAVVISSTIRDTNVSTSTPDSSKTAQIETEPTSSLTAGLRDTSTHQEESLSRDPSKNTAVTNMRTTDDEHKSHSFVSTDSEPSKTVLPMNTAITIGKTTVSIPMSSFSETPRIEAETSSSLMFEMRETSTSKETSSSTEKTTILPDMNTSSVTEVTKMEDSTGAEKMFWTSPASVEETSSPSSPVTLSAVTSPSTESPTLPGRSPSSPPPVTSRFTHGVVKTTDILGTGLGPGTSSTSIEISSTTEILSTSGVSTSTEAIQPSKNTAETHGVNTSSGHEAHSSTPADSQPSDVTSPVVTLSTSRETTVSTSVTHSTETMMIETDSTSSLSPELSETSAIPQNSSTTEKITLLSKVPTDMTTELSKTQPISSTSTSSPGPTQSSLSPDTPKGIITSLSTSPLTTESAEMTITSQTGLPEATSQGTLTLNTVTKASGAGTHPAVTQSFTHSEMSTLMSRGPQDVSWTSPASVEETSSPSSPVTLSAMTSPSPESPTLPGRSPSSPPPVTSLLTHGLVKTTDTLGTGLASVTSSTSIEISSTTETLSTSGISTSTEMIQPSENTAETHGVNTSSGHEAHSSTPADSEPSDVTSQIVTPSSSRENPVSTPVPRSTETTMIETDSTSSLSPELRKTSTIQQNSSTTEKITLLSKVPTDMTTELSKTQPISSTSISSPGLTQSTVSPDTPKGIITTLSTSPLTTESAEMTITSQTGPSEATSQGTLTLNTVTEASGPGTHPAVTQSFTHSEMSTLMNRGPQDVSWTSPASVEETSSPSSPVTLSAITSPSPESPTLPGRSPSSPSPVTSLFTHGLVKATGILGTGLASVTSSPSIEISSTTETLSTSGISTSTEMIQPSENTAETHGVNTSSGHEAHSSTPADSEPSDVTSQIVTPSSSRENPVSTPVPRSTETTMIETDSTSSLSPELRKTSTIQQNSSTTEKITLLSKVPTDITTELSKTQPISSTSISSPGTIQSTVSPDTPKGIITSLSTSPMTTESAEMTITSQTGLPEATSQGTLTLNTVTEASGAGTHPAVTQSFTHSEMSTLMSRGPQDVSWTSPASVEETSSPSSPVTLSAMTSPSPESPTLPGRSPSSPPPVTSLFTHGLVKATDILGTGLASVTSSTSIEISSTTETLSTSGISTSTEMIQPSENTAETHGVNTSSGHEAHSSTPADSEPSDVTSQIVTPSSSRENPVSTPVPRSTETIMIETDSTSSLSPELRKTSTIQQNSSTTEKITLLSKVPTDITTELSKTQPISSTSISSPGTIQSTVSPDTPKGIITSLSTSPMTTESAEMTITSQTGLPEATSQGTLTLNTVTEASGPGTHPAVTQSFTHSEMSTLMSRGPQDVSWTSPASVEETSSPSSPVTLSAITSPSPESPTLPGRSPSSPSPVTSLLTHGLVKTTDTLGTGLRPVTSSPSINISSTIEILSTSGVSSSTEVIQPSKSTARTHGVNTSSGPEVHSSTPADSEPSDVTSPFISLATSRETAVSTAMPHSIETMTIETDSTSSLSPELRETSTIQQNSSTTEEITLLSKVPTDTTTELSKTQPISSSSTFIPGPTQSTVSPDTPEGIITNLSTSPMTTESAEMTITSQRGLPEATSQDTLTLDTSTSSPSSSVHSSAMMSPSPQFSIVPGKSPSSPTPATSLLTSGLMNTTEKLDAIFKPVTTSPPPLSSPTMETLSTSEFSTDTVKILPSMHTTMTTEGSSSSGHELSSSGSNFSESSRITYPASSRDGITLSTLKPSSFETTTFETKKLSHLTPGLKETSMTLRFGSSTLTNTPALALSTHSLKSPKMDVTSSVTSSAPVQSLSTQDTDVPVKTVTRFYASPSVIGSAGVTLPESSLSMPVSASTHHLHTDMVSSAETILANTLTSPASEAMASFATSGVPGAISATSSDGPFSRTESDPKEDTRSTTANGLSSSASTPFPSSTLHTTDPSMSSLSHWIPSSPATPSTVDTNLDTESRRTSESPLVMTSTLQTWTQPYRTSLPPTMDTRMTGNVGLGTVTSSFQVIPHSTQSTSTDDIVKHITKIPNKAAHGGTTIHIPQASTSASLTGLSTRGTERTETTATALKTTVTVTTRVSTPTSGMLPLLRTSDKKASTSTIGTIITTPDSPKMTASLTTRPGDETSTTVPMTTPSIFSRGPETTPSLDPSSGAEMSTVVPMTTSSIFSRGPETTPSLVTSSGAETSTVVPMTTSSIFSRGPETATSLVPSSGAETSTVVPMTTSSIFSRGPETATSLVPSSGAETSTVVPMTTSSIFSRGPETATSLVPSSGAETSTVVPMTTSSIFSRGPETATSLVPSSGAETSTVVPMTTSAAVPTLTVSSDEPETTTSWVTHPAETSPTVSRAILNVSPRESDSTSPTTTSSGKEVSTAVPTPTVSPEVLGMVTSLVASPGTETSSADQTLAVSPGKPETTVSLITHPGTRANLSVPTPTVSPDVSRVEISPTTTSGAKTSTTFPTMTGFPHEQKTTASLVTNHGTEAISIFSTLTVSPDEQDTTASWLHSTETSTPDSKTTLNFSPRELDTTSSATTSPGAEASSATPVMTISPSKPVTVTSLVISSGTDTSTTFPTSTGFLHELESTVSLVTQPPESDPTVPKTMPISHNESDTMLSVVTSLGAKVSSVPTTTVSPGISGMVTSPVTSSTAETSSTSPTLTGSLHEPKTTASWVTHSETKVSSTVPTMTVFPEKSDTTVSLVTHPEETSSTVPRKTSSVSHSKSNTTFSVATSPGEEFSSAVPATTVSPAVSGIVTSQVTNSVAQTSTTFTTVTDSMYKSETTASGVTHTEKDASSAIPTMTILPGKPDTTVSLVTHLEETSRSIPRTTPNVSQSEFDTTPSIATSPGAEGSSAVPAMTISPGVPEMMTSLITSSVAEASTTIPTLTDSTHKPETTASGIIHSGTETSPAVPTMTVSPGKPNTTVSVATHPEETSPTLSRTTPSVSHTETDTTFSTATSPWTESSSPVPATTVSPSVSKLGTSLVTSSRKEISTTLPTLTASPGQVETTASWVTHSEPKASPASPTPPVSTSVPHIVNPQATSSETKTSMVIPALTLSPFEPKTTASLVTHPEMQASSATSVVFSTMPRLVTSLFTSSGTETSTAFTIPTDSSHKPETAASWVMHSMETNTPISRTTPSFPHSKSDITPSMATSSEAKASSAIPTTTISPSVPDVMTSLITSSRAEISTTFRTVTDSTHKPEATALAVTHSGTKTNSAILTMTVSPKKPETTVSLVTHSKDTSHTVPRTTSNVFQGLSDTTPSMTTSPAAEVSSAVPAKTVSPSIPGMVTSLVTISEAETSTTFPTLTDSLYESKTTTSWITHSETKASSAVPTFPTLTDSTHKPETTASEVTHSGKETSSAISTMTVSAGKPDTTVSLVIHHEETSPSVPRTTSKVSQSKSDTTTSTATSPGTETSSAVPATTVSPGVSGLVTSLVTNSVTEISTTSPPQTNSTLKPETTTSGLTQTETSSAVPILIASPGKPDTTVSLVTHPEETSSTVPRTTSKVSQSESDTTTSTATSPGTETSSAVPATTVSPGVSGLVTSLVTNSMTQISTTSPPQTNSTLKPETTASGVTQTETSSAVPILIASPGRPDTTVSFVTHPEETRLTVPKTTLSVSHSESNTTPSTNTSPEAETSSAVPTMAVSHGKPDTTVSLVIHHEETSPTVPRTTSKVSQSESDTTTSTATSPGTETSSAVPATTVSPGVSGLVTSLVTNSVTQISTTSPPQTNSTLKPETTASGVTQTETSSAVPILIASPGRPDTTVSRVTHPEETSPTVPRTTSKVSQSESDTTTSTATSPGTETSSAVPATTVSPGVSGLVTSLVTNSVTQISTTSPPQTNSTLKPETTASGVTQTETSSAVPILIASPGKPDTTVSLVTHPEETSSTVPRTTSKVSQSESDTTTSTATSPGTETSSAVPATTVSPGVSGLVTSLVTNSMTQISTTSPPQTNSTLKPETTASGVTQTETSSAVPILIASPGRPDTTVSFVTHPEETRLTVPKTTLSVSHSESNTTPSTNTSPEAETSSAVPTMAVSHGKPDTTVSLVIHHEETSPTVPRTTSKVSQSESDTTTSTATSPGTETSSAVPATTVSPGVSGLVTSLVTNSVTQISTTSPPQTNSTLKPETTASGVTQTETSSAVPILIASPGRPDTTVSRVTHPEETSPTVPRTTSKVSQSESDTTTSTATSPGTETSSAVPATTVSPGVSGLVTSLVTNSVTQISTTSPPQTNSTLKPETTASGVTQTETSSAVPILIASPGRPDTTVSRVTHPEETSPTVLKTTPSISHSESDTAPSTATRPRTETSSAVPATTVSPSLPYTVNSETDTTMVILPLTLSPGEPATTALLVTSSSAKTSTNSPASTVFPHLPETTASPSIWPELETSTALPSQTVSLSPPETFSLFTIPVTMTARVDLNPTVSLGVPAETASVSTEETELSTAIRVSAISHGLPETTGLLATSPEAKASTSLPALTLSPGGLGPSRTPATTVELYTVTSGNTETSPPATSVELSEFPKNVTGDTVTLRPSETTMQPKTSHVEELSTTTILKTTTVETTHLAATGSGPTVAETTTTFNTLAGSPFAHVTTPGTSTLASVTVTSGTTIAAAIPFLMPFTVNFTITNLQYTEDLGHSDSKIFKDTERDLQLLLRPLFRNSSIGSRYASCRLTLLRADKDETSTRMDAVCTYRSDPTGFRLDTERLYWELSQQTQGVTRLDHYTLDRNSLYVNGYNHRYWIPTTSTPVTSTFSPGPPASPTSIPSSTVADMGPALVPFTLNFTVTNPFYTPDMGHRGSEKFNFTEKVLNHLLGPLLKNTSVGPLYSNCRLTLLRTEKDGAATGVDAICTYHPDPTHPGLDREKLYRELSQLTHGVTRMGKYTLDSNSLYVNGYNRQYWMPTTSTPVTSTFSLESSTSLSPILSSTGMSPSLVPFTLNFTITNLNYTDNMSPPGSELFNTMERILNRLLKPLFQNSSIELLYSGCRLTLLRPEKNRRATGVDAVCTHRPNPMGLKLDRERLYRELSHETHGVTQLGSFTLDKDSLYVNGYTQWTSASTTSAAGTSPTFPGTSMVPTHLPSSTAGVPLLMPFTLNFTITNLTFEEDLQRPGSWKFNATKLILKGLLKHMFKNSSSLGSLYSGCRLALLRPEKDGAATRVDAICMHRPDPKGPGLDREQLYWELSHLTHGVTLLGPYTLDKDSLYVNGYTHQALNSTPSIASPALVPFTLNFTINNLLYVEDMHRPGSWKFNNTERVLQDLLRLLFKNTRVGHLYSGCRLTALRPEKNGAATGVDAVCTHRPDPVGPGLDREQLYWELSQLTHGVTQLGPYSLDQDSLYVNGYSHWTSATTANTTDLHLVSFTLNFTITNVHYSEDMGRPSSLKFSTTERILQHRLRVLLNKTSVGPLYAGCRLELLRPEKRGAATGVNVVCSLRSDPARPALNKEQLYWELSRETDNITQLGSFSLDRNSLYVNGYTYAALAPTTTTGEVSEKPFTLNFTIDNLRYSADMGHPGSHKFNITDTLMQHLLSPLFQRSSLGARYAGCRVISLRSVNNGAKTGVNILCTYRQSPSGPGLLAKQVFHELSRQTHGITRLGPYSLDKDSLYLNGYNERGPDEPPTTPAPATTFLPTSPSPVQPESTTAMGYNLKALTLNFTITNLPYSSDMSSGFAMFNSTKMILHRLLGSLFQKSSLGPFYSSCRLISLKPEKDSAATSVYVVCTYHPDPMGHRLDIEQLYWELSQLTHGVTQLGFYTLVKDSLFINGYAPQSLSIQREYQLNFHIINWNLSNQDPTSSEYIALLWDISDKVTKLYRSSQLQGVFLSCLVTNLTLDPISVTIKAQFSSRVDSSMVKQVFLDKTLNASSHWLGATYQLTDVHVTEAEPSIHLPTDQPTTTPSFQKVQLNFIVTNLFYSQDMKQPDTPKYQTNKRNIEDALNQLFRNSSIKTHFSDCEVSAFRSVSPSNHTGVNAQCNFAFLARSPYQVVIYEEFLRLTKNGTQLQNFTLDRNSLLVDGYSPNRNDVVTENSDLPFWAIILICLAGLLVLIMGLISFFLVRVHQRKKEADYEVQQLQPDSMGYYLPHLDLRKLQ